MINKKGYFIFCKNSLEEEISGSFEKPYCESNHHQELSVNIRDCVDESGGIIKENETKLYSFIYFRINFEFADA